jgi:hypothetical protein
MRGGDADRWGPEDGGESEGRPVNKELLKELIRWSTLIDQDEACETQPSGGVVTLSCAQSSRSSQLEELSGWSYRKLASHNEITRA